MFSIGYVITILRGGSNTADIQVKPIDKGDEAPKSHVIARFIRPDNSNYREKI